MKIEIVIGIVGAVAVGACIYALTKSARNKDEATSTRGVDYEMDNSTRKDVGVVTTSYTDASDADMGQIKQDVASSISSRHKVAEAVIKESVSNIFSETNSSEERNTKNKESLNQAFEDLKRL